jgi:hypothetical protein
VVQGAGKAEAGTKRERNATVKRRKRRMRRRVK